jgi:hypothetical protein
MRKTISSLFVIVSVLSICYTAHSETTTNTLAFYVVSKTNFEGAVFIDTRAMPKLGYVGCTLGYIGSKPDLVVTNVQSVLPNTNTNIVIAPDKNGSTNWITPDELSEELARELVVNLQPQDAERLIALTGKSVGKQMLVMLGTKPLATWETGAKFPEGRFEVQCQNDAELKATKDVLKKLVR